MQDILKKADIDGVRADLELRRREILARHAEEARTLDAERTAVDQLNHLIELFTQKFVPRVVTSHQPIAAPAVKQPAPAAVKQTERYPLSNFATYARAMARC
ncbi:MAG TPA: hypothetical protein VGS13_01305 [Stellaceae bacterium]|nr:hypothetical protein [Stellaceae bacterium]